MPNRASPPSSICFSYASLVFPLSLARSRFYGVIPRSCLHRHFLGPIYLDLQLVKLAVQLLGRESQYINELRHVPSLPEALPKVVVVVEKHSAGAIGEVGQYFAPRGSFIPVECASSQQILAVAGGYPRRPCSLHIESVEDDSRPHRPIDQGHFP